MSPLRARMAEMQTPIPVFRRDKLTVRHNFPHMLKLRGILTASGHHRVNHVTRFHYAAHVYPEIVRRIRGDGQRGIWHENHLPRSDNVTGYRRSIRVYRGVFVHAQVARVDRPGQRVTRQQRDEGGEGPCDFATARTADVEDVA